MPLATALEEEIRAAATIASLALALLVFFTNIRRESLKKYLGGDGVGGVGELRPKTIRSALPDLALALLTTGAVVSMAPLCFDTFHLDKVGRRSGVLPSMFALIWLGFVLVLLFQVWMLVRRLWPAITNSYPAIEEGWGKIKVKAPWSPIDARWSRRVAVLLLAVLLALLLAVLVVAGVVLATIPPVVGHNNQPVFLSIPGTERRVMYSSTPSNCHVLLGPHPELSRPDRRCTPGSVDPTVTQATVQDTICEPGWTDTVRPPDTRKAKKEMYHAYGISPQTSELDHLIPLALGGSNDITNLWIEVGKTPNAKDALEKWLQKKVCSGLITLQAARAAIVANWMTAG